MKREEVCNRDCFHCPYEDCIVEDVTAAEDQERRKTEKDLLFVRDFRQRKIAAYQKAYRDSHKDEIAAYQKAYRARKKATQK